jgi:WD40 repeat protein
LAIGSERGIYLVDLSVPASFIYKELPGKDVHTESLSFSRGGKWLAIGRSDNMVMIMDARTGEFIGQPIKDAGAEVAFNPTSSIGQLAITDKEGNISMGWFDSDGKLWSSRRQYYPPGTSSVVLFPSKNTFFATGSRDGSIALWEESRSNTFPLAERLDEEDLKGNGNAQYMAFNKSGSRFLAIDDQSVRDLWSVSGDHFVYLKPSKHLEDLNAGEFQYALNCYARDNRQVLCFNEGEVEFKDPTNATKPSLRFPIDMSKTLRESKPAVLGVGNELLATLGFNDVTLWDIRKNGDSKPIGSPLKAPSSQDDKGFARCLALSRDNKLLAVGYDNGEILLWDVEKHSLLRTLSPYRTSDRGITKGGQVIAVALSSDGSVLASSSRPNSISLWDTGTGNLIGRIDTGRGGYLAFTLALSSDGKKLVSGGVGKLFVWDIDPASLAKRALAVANQQ